MTNDPPRTKEVRIPKPEARREIGPSALVIRVSSFLRHWWIIRHSALALQAFVICLSASAADLPAGAARRIGDGRFLHAEAVRDVAPAPDGRAVASFDAEAVYLWDAATGALRFRAECDPDHEHRIVWVGWAGGTVRAVAAFRGEVRGLRLVEFDPATGRVTRRGPVAPARLTPAAVAPGGDRVVAVRRANDRSDTLTLHDLTAGRPPVVLTDTAVGATAEFAPDGKTVAVGDGGPTVRVFDAATGKPVRGLKTDADEARVGPFTPDGTGLVVFVRKGEKWSAAVRDAATGAVRTVLPTDADGRFVRVRFAPDGKRAALQEHRADCEVIDLGTGVVVGRPPDGTDWLAFAPDGRTYYAHPEDKPVFVPCDVATGKPTLAPAGPVHRLRFRNDGKLLGVAGGRVVAWDPATGAELSRSTPVPDLSEDYPAFGSLSPDGTRYAYLAGTNDQRVHLYDVPGGLIRTTFDTDVRHPFSGFLRSGALVLPHPGRVGVYDPATGAEAAAVRVGVSGFRGMDGSADGRRLVVGVPEGAVVVGLPGGEPVAHFPWPGGGTGTGAALSPDGRTAFAAGGGAVAAWDVDTGRRRWEKPLVGREVRWVSVLPDGRSAAVATQDNAVLLVEVATGAVRETFAGTGQPILSFTVAPDGRWVATASPDGPVFLWDVRGSAAGPSPDAAGLAKLWADLAAADAAVAYRAVRALAKHPDRAVPFLAEKVAPVPAVDPARVAKRIAELDSPAYAVREAAARELRKIGEPAGPALEAALAKTASAEVRERVKGLLLAIPKPSAEDVRRLRAAEVLEWTGTPAAKAALATLAAGADGASLTRDAQAAVGRMR